MEMPGLWTTYQRQQQVWSAAEPILGDNYVRREPAGRAREMIQVIWRSLEYWEAIIDIGY